MHDDTASVDRAVAAAAEVLRPWADHLQGATVTHVDQSGPVAQPRAIDPATAIAGLSLLLGVLTFWQSERHHRDEMARLDREAAERRADGDGHGDGGDDVLGGADLRDEVAALRLPPDRVADELAAAGPDAVAAGRAAMADVPAVRTDVAALLGRAGVPVTEVARVLDDLSAATA